MDSPSELKELFIHSAMRVVARNGLERASTRAIAADAHRNEAYIYRCFQNKDELLHAALHMEDVQFMTYLRRALAIMSHPAYAWKHRCFLLWKSVWNFILQREEECRFYLRYYYSQSCRDHAYAEHMEGFRSVIELARPIFRDGTNVDALIQQLFDTMLCFALRVVEGELPNDRETTCWTFEQIYAFVSPHFRPEVFADDAPAVPEAYGSSRDYTTGTEFCPPVTPNGRP